MGKLIDETGKTYGYLTVIERAKSKDGRAMWKCKCKCGNECVVSGKFLRNGHTQSCGCLKIERTIARNMERGGGDLTGQRFGKLVVIGFDSWLDHNNGHKDRMWRCKCDCGKIFLRRSDIISRADVKSCGCHQKSNNNLFHIFNYQLFSYQSPRQPNYIKDKVIIIINKQIICWIIHQTLIFFICFTVNLYQSKVFVNIICVN